MRQLIQITEKQLLDTILKSIYIELKVLAKGLRPKLPP
jgi:hypothetical protein